MALQVKNLARLAPTERAEISSQAQAHRVQVGAGPR